MELMTKAIKNKIPALYAQDGKGDNAIVHLKLFTPDGGWTGYFTEFDGENILFGWSGFQEKELGYSSLSEIRQVRGRCGLPIERDKWFTPKTLGEVKAND